MSLFPILTKKQGQNLYLPAHGRGAGLPKSLKRLLNHRAGIWDIPELPDFGSPLDQEGAVAKSQQEAAESIGAQKGWFGVNGATGLLQAALLAIVKPGEAVLMPRNVHRSLIQACALGQFKPVLFDIPFMADRGHGIPPNGEWLQEVLTALSTTKETISGAVLVHPTYHGYATELRPLVDQLHQKGLPVLVDEAHGAHFSSGVNIPLPDSALKAGADLVVHSLHKSAAGLAQTAVLWMQGNRVDSNEVERTLSWLQTSSPSSLLLASCEAALKEWSEPIGRNRLEKRLIEAMQIAKKLQGKGVPLLENQDPLRLILHTSSKGISGLDADKWLIKRGLIAELPEPGCLTFCLGLAPHKGLERILERHWKSLLLASDNKNCFPAFKKPPIPKVNSPEITPWEAWSSAKKKIKIKRSTGGISAELICPYPPGIPLVIPGEKLDEARVNWLLEQKELWPNQISDEIMIVA